MDFGIPGVAPCFGCFRPVISPGVGWWRYRVFKTILHQSQVASVFHALFARAVPFSSFGDTEQALDHPVLHGPQHRRLLIFVFVR